MNGKKTEAPALRLNIAIPSEVRDKMARLDAIFTTIGTVFADAGQTPKPEEIIAAAVVRGLDEMHQDCERILRMSLSPQAVAAIMKGVYR